VGSRGAAAAARVTATSTRDLFAPTHVTDDRRLELGEGAAVLRGFALPFERALADGVRAVSAGAPFRHMQTPGGYSMSVAMTSGPHPAIPTVALTAALA